MYNITITANGSNPVTETVLSSEVIFNLPSNRVTPNTDYSIVILATSSQGPSNFSEPVDVSKLTCTFCFIMQYSRIACTVHVCQTSLAKKRCDSF